MKTITLSPSLICADLMNLQKEIGQIEKVGIDTLHIDIIDGYFSPSLPLGFSVVEQLRKITNLKLDFHIMACDNEFFINEALKLGAENITFHVETSRHIQKYIDYIHAKNTKVGLALNPATNFDSMEWVFDQIDMVTIMLINPGYASDGGEKPVAYGIEKVNRLMRIKEEHNYNFDIQVDGRVSFETIPKLIKNGANNLVLGSRSLFNSESTIQKNYNKIIEAIRKTYSEGNK